MDFPDIRRSSAMIKMAKVNETPDDYRPFVDQVMSAFRENAAQETTRPEDVVQAIWRAVADPDCPLCLPAGSDAVALAA